MKIGIMLLAILPMLIASGVNGGMDFGFSSGTAGKDFSHYGSHIEAGDGVGVSGQILLQGDDLAGNCEFNGVGVIQASETKSNSDGDSVTLAANGNLKKKDAYSTSWSGVGEQNVPIMGLQHLKGAGTDIHCIVKAENRDKLRARVEAGVGSGSIDIQQIGTASETGVDSWQKIAEASGDNIELKAKTSDNLGINSAKSSVTVDHGNLKNYNSEAASTYLDDKKRNIDVSAIHGAFSAGLDPSKFNPTGSISGDLIHSEGTTYNEKGLSARYGVTINQGSVKGRFDCGVETISNGFVIAVPLESPKAWGGYVNPKPGKEKITISGLEISSYSKAKIGTKVVSIDDADATGVNLVQKGWYKLPSDWALKYGFAEPSEAYPKKSCEFNQKEGHS